MKIWLGTLIPLKEPNFEFGFDFDDININKNQDSYLVSWALLYPFRLTTRSLLVRSLAVNKVGLSLGLRQKCSNERNTNDTRLFATNCQNVDKQSKTLHQLL